MHKCDGVSGEGVGNFGDKHSALFELDTKCTMVRMSSSFYLYCIFFGDDLNSGPTCQAITT